MIQFEIGPNLANVLLAVVPVLNTALLAWIAVKNHNDHASIKKEVRDGNWRTFGSLGRPDEPRRLRP